VIIQLRELWRRTRSKLMGTPARSRCIVLPRTPGSAGCESVSSGSMYGDSRLYPDSSRLYWTMSSTHGDKFLGWSGQTDTASRQAVFGPSERAFADSEWCVRIPSVI
jgi:hypothetical protein